MIKNVDAAIIINREIDDSVEPEKQYMGFKLEKYRGRPNKDRLYVFIHPFDENNDEDMKKLTIWRTKNTKFYNQAIYVWTDLDVRKRNIAKKNKLNYIELFSHNISELIIQFENKNIF